MSRISQISSSKLITLLMTATVVISGCSNGGSSSVSTVSGTSTTTNTGTGTVTAYVSKGPITGASCNAFNAANNKLAGPIKTVNGKAVFTGVAFPSSSGIVKVECVGGTYTDEATGATKTSGTLRAATTPDGNTASVAITPFTELAVRKSASDLADYYDQAFNVATAVGIPDVNLSAISPTDLNTTKASNDDAGRYGIALAAFSQMVKDTGSTTSGVITSLQTGITGSTLAAAQATAFKSALAALPASPVKANLDSAIADTQYANLAGATSSVPYVLPNSITISPVAPVVFGTNVTISGRGGRLPTSAVATLSTGGTCGTVTITNDTSFSVNCLAPTSGGTATFALKTSSGTAIDGASASYVLAATSSASGAATSLAAVAPTSVNYASTSTFTVIGYNFPNGVTARLSDGVTNNNCSAGSSQTVNQLTFNCMAPNDRSKTTATLSLTLPGKDYPLTSSVTLVAGTTSITSVSPNALTQGSQAPSSWTVNGTGLHSGISFAFNGGSCSTTSALSDGTQMTINCSSVTVPSGVTSANLVATLSSSSTLTTTISINSLPVAPLMWQNGGSSTLKVGLNSITTLAYVAGTFADGSTATSCVSATNNQVSYSYTSNPSAGVVNNFTQTTGGNFTLTTGNTAGTVTITATVPTISGVCMGRSITYTLTVSALDPVELKAMNDHIQKLDATSTYQQIATVLTPTAGSGVTTTISYSIDSATPAGSVTCDTTCVNTGNVTINGVGTAVIKATGSATGYASNSRSYNLTIEKSDVQFTTPSIFNATIGSNTVDNSIKVSALASRSGMPGVTGGPVYSSSDATVASINGTGQITPLKTGVTTITVSYAGDANYKPKTFTYNFTVNKGTTSAIQMSWLSVPSTTMTLGQYTTPSAKASQIGVGPTPSQSITYTADGTVLQITGYETSGKPIIKAVSVSTAGWVKATFNGDTNYASGSEVIVSNIVVNKATATMAYQTSYPVPSTMATGSSAKVRITVTGGNYIAAPTGTVTITPSDTTKLTATGCSAVTLTNGAMTTDCTLTVPTGATTGTVTLTATYSGDGNYVTSAVAGNSLTSNTINIQQGLTPTLSIGKYSGTSGTEITTITLSSTSSSETFRIRVTPSLTTDPNPSGQVTLSIANNNNNIVTMCVPLALNLEAVAGQAYSESAQCTISRITAGTVRATITATYSGDGNYNTGTAKTITVNSD